MAILVICLVFVIWFLIKYISKYCVNPYYLHVVVGSKGSGKSLYMAKLANQWMSHRRGEVYSNMGIGFDLQPEYWKQSFPPDSLILIDEVGVLHSNRDFKNFPREAIEWYKMQRKRRLTVVVSSQTMDVDKKIRDLADVIYVCRRYSWVCALVPYRNRITMITTPEGGHDLVNDIKRAGAPRLYTVPKTVQLTETLGYKTDQIIAKEDAAIVQKAASRRKGKAYVIEQNVNFVQLRGGQALNFTPVVLRFR